MKSRKINFSAQVNREIKETVRFKLDVAQKDAFSKSHRWSQKVPSGILFETLGDLYIKNGSKLKNLTKSKDHETNPVFDSKTKKIFLYHNMYVFIKENLKHLGKNKTLIYFNSRYSALKAAHYLMSDELKPNPRV